MQWTMQGDQICHIWSWPCFGSHKPLFSDPILRDRGKPDPKHCQLQYSDLQLIFRCRINQTLSDQNWRVYTGFCVNSVFGHWAAKPSTNADQEQLFFWPLPSFYQYSSSKMPPVWLLKVQFLNLYFLFLNQNQLPRTLVRKWQVIMSNPSFIVL